MLRHVALRFGSPVHCTCDIGGCEPSSLHVRLAATRSHDPRHRVAAVWRNELCCTNVAKHRAHACVADGFAPNRLPGLLDASGPRAPKDRTRAQLPPQQAAGPIKKLAQLSPNTGRRSDAAWTHQTGPSTTQHKLCMQQRCPCLRHRDLHAAPSAAHAGPPLCRR